MIHNDFDSVFERSLGRVHPVILETMRLGRAVQPVVGGLQVEGEEREGERVRKERISFASLLERNGSFNRWTVG